jgi:elongation factor G
MALAKLMQEDPTLPVNTDPDTGQTHHLRHGRAAPRDHRRPPDREFNVGANVGKPQVAYRETVRTRPMARAASSARPAAAASTAT